MRRQSGMRDVATAIAVVFDCGLGLWAGTEWIARRLGYLGALGVPVYAVASSALTWWVVATIVIAGAAGGVLFVRVWRRLAPIGWIVAGVCGWMARGRPVYAPWSIVAWHWRFRSEPHVVAIVQHGWAVAAVVAAIGALVMLPLFVSGRPSEIVPTSQGTAAWNVGKSLVTRDGLVIGWQDAVTRGRG